MDDHNIYKALNNLHLNTPPGNKQLGEQKLNISLSHLTIIDPTQTLTINTDYSRIHARLAHMRQMPLVLRTDNNNNARTQ